MTALLERVARSLSLRGVEIGEAVSSEGAYRGVFSSRSDPAVVVKVEGSEDSFCNAMEWRLWRELQHTRLGGWLAPCLDIGDRGAWMVQARTAPISAWPDGEAQALPSIFSDVKLANFGMLGGRLVCHDYAQNLLASRAAGSFDLVPVRDLPGDHCYDDDE